MWDLAHCVSVTNNCTSCETFVTLTLENIHPQNEEQVKAVNLKASKCVGCQMTHVH